MDRTEDRSTGPARRAAVCGLLLLALAGCETVAEIDRGLYQATSAVSEKDRVTGLRALSFENREMQISQGNAYAEQVLDQLRASGQPLDGEIDRRAYRRLSRIFERVHEVSHLRDEDWRVVMLPEREINAFVTGGTVVFVNHGTVVRLPDDQIAAILGHELAHVSGNHLFENRTGALAELFAGRGRSAGLAAAYSREAESEADRIGTLYAALAGYDPMAAPRLWARMGRTYPRAPGYLDSHPMAQARMAETARIATLSRAYHRPGEMNPDHEVVLACNSIFCAVDDEPEPGEGGGLFATVTLGLDVVSKRLAAEAEEQRRRNELQGGRSGTVPWSFDQTVPWQTPWAAPDPLSRGPVVIQPGVW